LDSQDEILKTRNEILRVVPAMKGWTIDVDPKNAI